MPIQLSSCNLRKLLITHSETILMIKCLFFFLCHELSERWCSEPSFVQTVNSYLDRSFFLFLLMGKLRNHFPFVWYCCMWFCYLISKCQVSCRIYVHIISVMFIWVLIVGRKGKFVRTCQQIMNFSSAFETLRFLQGWLLPFTVPDSELFKVCKAHIFIPTSV